MKAIRYLWVNLTQTCLRVIPFRCKTGLYKIGNPDSSSPVLLTCNFRLTVERVKKALAGIDAYLLVANSRGVNVWCAATGGLLTNHDIISALKTSGVQDQVRHRKIVLPQLAATGVEGKRIEEKTGWTVIWGPVYATDIPAFLNQGFRKTAEMRRVHFRWRERMEMAVSWAFPMSVLLLVGFPLLGNYLLPLVGLIWALSILIFLGFPVYQAYLQSSRHVVARQFTVGLTLAGALGVTFVTGAAVSENLSWEWATRWSLAALVILLIISVEITGTTPVYKSGLHEDRLLQIVLDSNRCGGIGICEQVCPTAVFEVSFAEQTAALVGERDCVQCGACIVQCPLDALYFSSPSGHIVTPEAVRKFKLNLLGKRLVNGEG